MAVCVCVCHSTALKTMHAEKSILKQIFLFCVRANAFAVFFLFVLFLSFIDEQWRASQKTRMEMFSFAFFFLGCFSF